MKTLDNYINFAPAFQDWTKFKIYWIDSDAIIKSWKKDYNAENVKNSNFFYTIVNKYLAKNYQKISEQEFQNSDLKITSDKYRDYLEFTTPSGSEIKVSPTKLLLHYTSVKNFSDNLGEFDEKVANLVKKIKWLQNGGVFEYFKQANNENLAYFIEHYFLFKEEFIDWQHAEKVLADRQKYLKLEKDEIFLPIHLKYFVAQKIYQNLDLSDLTKYHPKEILEYITLKKDFNKKNYGEYLDYLNECNYIIDFILKQEKILNNRDLDESVIAKKVYDPSLFFKTRQWREFKVKPFEFGVDIYGDIDLDLSKEVTYKLPASEYLNLSEYKYATNESEFYLQNYNNPSANFEAGKLKELASHDNSWIANKAKTTLKAINNYYKYYSKWKDIPQEYQFYHLISLASTEQEHDLIRKYYQNHNYFSQPRQQECQQENHLERGR